MPRRVRKEGGEVGCPNGSTRLLPDHQTAKILIKNNLSHIFPNEIVIYMVLFNFIIALILCSPIAFLCYSLTYAARAWVYHICMTSQSNTFPAAHSLSLFLVTMPSDACKSTLYKSQHSFSLHESFLPLLDSLKKKRTLCPLQFFFHFYNCLSTISCTAL